MRMNQTSNIRPTNKNNLFEVPKDNAINLYFYFIQYSMYQFFEFEIISYALRIALEKYIAPKPLFFKI